MAKSRAANTELGIVVLNDRQKQFCHEYVLDFNGTRAAIAAGYSEKTAAVIASENLTKPNISTYIEKLQSDLGKLCNVSAAMAILELKKVAFTSAASLLDNWGELKDWEELSEEQKSLLAEVEVTEKIIKGTGKGGPTVLERKTKFKTKDQLAALRLMAQMLGWNAPKKVEQVKKSIPPTRQELEAELQLIKKARGISK